MTATTTRPVPFRWRKAKRPNFSYSKQPAMEAMIWARDRSRDLVLWRGPTEYATVTPTGRWTAYYKSRRETGVAATVEQAKANAKSWVLAEIGGRS